MLKSLTIIGLVSLILGIILSIYLNIYWSMAAIFGFPIFILGLVITVGDKKKKKEGPETIYCSNCGSVLTKGTQYCPYCGKKL
ncbi:MAG: zinc ribbon domain-containing protein [Candidatus Helarchaeota archaeon]